MQAFQIRLLLAIMLTQAFAIGLSYGIYPIFLQPLEASFDASRTLISAGQIIIMVAMSVGGVLVGTALDNGHPRRIMLAGATLMGTAFALGAVAEQLWLLGLVAFAIGLCIPAIGPLVSAGLVTRFFLSERGRALGLMSIGPPLGSGVFAALSGVLLPAYGWQLSFAVFSALCLLVLLPVIWAVIPARFPESPSRAGGSGASQSRVIDVARRPAFFWTVLSYALMVGTMTAWTVHVAAFLGTHGLSAAAQSMVLAVSFWMGIPGALLSGFMADRWPAQRLFATMLVVLAAMLMLFSLHPKASVLVVLVASSGLLTGGVVPLYTMMLGQRLPTEDFGKAMGLSNLFVLPVMAVAVIVAASLFERHGDYRLALHGLAGLATLAVFCLLLSNHYARRA